MTKVLKTFKIQMLMLILFLISSENVLGQLLSLDTVYVTSEKYTVEYQRRKEAREDIVNGYVLVHRGGWFGVSEKIDSLANNYGFKFIQIGCVPIEGIEYYNDEVVRYLTKRNGEGWWEKFLDEESKLQKTVIPSLPWKEEN